MNMRNEKQTQAEFMQDGFEKLIDHLIRKHTGPNAMRDALQDAIQIMNRRQVSRVNSQVGVSERRLVYIGKLQRKLTERRESDNLIIDLARDLEALAHAENNVSISVRRAREGGLFDRTLGSINEPIAPSVETEVEA